MLLTLTTTARPATDLGYLLHKHPERAQSFSATGGRAHVFYPVADDDVCTAALLLDLDPSAPVFAEDNRIDDRPYVAGSLMAVALGGVFGTAMSGRCEARPELAATPIPLVVHVPTLACRGDATLVERLFAPLGWRVEARPVPLDPAFPEWGNSHVVDATLTGTLRTADALSHLYVLLPVLDGAKHYRVGADEVDKLLRVGESWLAGHPERTLIAQRYLAHRGTYVRSALARLAESDDVEPETLDDALAPPVLRERSASLAEQRRAAVVEVLRELGARRVLDLGCGGGALLRDLLTEASFTEIVGADVSARALEVAERRLERLSERARARVRLRQSALTYADPTLEGYDAAVLMEVVEHVDEERLPALEHAVFAVARPGAVVVTTPNVEHNARYAGLTGLRHADHRFEWTRAQFRDWADGVCSRHGYTAAHHGIGAPDPDLGSPTQMAVLTR